jgi:pyruvate,water dikinase
MLIKNLFKYWTYQVFSPGLVLREKYEAFKSLLTHDKRAHELMAELEEIYYNQLRVDFSVIENKCYELSESVAKIVADLSGVCPSRYSDLEEFFKKIDSYLKYILAPKDFDYSPPYVIPLHSIAADSQNMVGGKAFNLATIKRELQFSIPDGFVITTNAFHHFIEANKLRRPIEERLSMLDVTSVRALDGVSRDISDLMQIAHIPAGIKTAISAALGESKKSARGEPRFAMRSSAVAEDSQTSFAGQYQTVLNVSADSMLAAYKTIIASKYTPRAIYYRVNYGLSDAETPMAVLALRMIDAKSSGVIYTREVDDPASANLKIHSIWGLGELLVSGKSAADVITVTRDGGPKIVDKNSGIQTHQMIYSQNNMNDIVLLEDDQKDKFSLDDASALTLAQWGADLESFYNEPQDIEWCTDQSGGIYLLQSRPLKTDDFRPAEAVECRFDDVESVLLLSKGERAAPGIAAGKVFKLSNESDLEAVPSDSVLVARTASPRYVKVMNRLSAVVADSGSIAGHFSSVAREFGVPTIVNAGTAFDDLPDGEEVTVYADGTAVYRGVVESMVESPCARRNLIADSPFMRRLNYILKFVATLELVDPDDRSFIPGGCRSFHDIVRFAHEKAVQEMFHISDNRMRKIGGARKLQTDIPMQFVVLDVGGGIKPEQESKKAIGIEDVSNRAMQAVFKGLSHPDIHWGSMIHFDWAEHDRITMSGGIISPKATMFASHVVLSDDYMNLNLRFGYHFVIVDALCGVAANDNYVLFRFSGGGADFDQRKLRAEFLSQILQRLEFEVNKTSDLVDARLSGPGMKAALYKLEILGRLLGATRLMDMYLKEDSQIIEFVEDFMKGRYHFASADE